MRGLRVLGAFPLAASVVAACAGDPPTVARTVTFHSLASCPVGAAPYALLVAAGDFQPASASAVTVQLPLERRGDTLDAIPAATRSLTVAVSGGASFDSRWRGFTEVAAQNEGGGDVDVVLWPTSGACPMSQPETALEPRTGAAVAQVGASRVLVAGGASPGVIPSSFVADVAEGTLTRLVSDLVVPRANATATSFGDGALVAGGQRPDTGELLDTAERFAGADFDGARIQLGEKRASHAAVVLATGETLLVGGRGATGALASLEVIDPKTRRTRGAGLPSLDAKRIGCVAVRLASGDVLVAGGVDDAGAPVGLLEWMSADLRRHVSRPFPAAERVAMVPLSGGGALVVLSPASPPVGFQNVWVVSADGVPEPATSIAGTLGAPHLFEGSAGAPVLFTEGRWLRWKPFAGEFGAMPEVTSTRGPDAGATLSVDGGLALWLDAEAGHGTLSGLRFDARGPYVTDSARGPLLVDGLTPFSPDRLVSASDGPVAFDSARGIVLDAGASAFLADATFADFALDLLLTGPAPLVVLRDETGAELEVGGASCAFRGASGAGSRLHVDRRGERVSVSLGGGAPTTCPTLLGATARVSIGLRGAEGGPSAARELVVLRR